jgi:membrane-bound metal-dependent hydrolase YbcI (DUF457 family)
LDNLTHTLFGVTLGRTPLGRAGRGTTAALVIASNAPDIDFVSAAGGTASYIQWHRGPTHGPIGVVVLGFMSAGIVWLWYWNERRRRPEAESCAPFALLFAIAAIGVFFHILMDLPTPYGTRFLSPFDWHWFTTDWMPIVDVYLLIALAAGLVFGRFSEAARRRNAAIVLAVVAANYGVRAVAHNRSLAEAPALFGPTLPAPCAPGNERQAILERWPRARLPQTAPDGRRCLVEMAALPSTSPFTWRIVTRMSNSYELSDVNLLGPAAGKVPWRINRRIPNVWTPTVMRAAETDVGQILLGFSRFPAVRWFEDGAGVTTARFSDMRFMSGLIALRPAGGTEPFTLVVRVARDGQILSETLGR